MMYLTVLTGVCEEVCVVGIGVVTGLVGALFVVVGKNDHVEPCYVMI